MLDPFGIINVAKKVNSSPPPLKRYAPWYVKYYGFLYYVMQDFNLRVALECGVYSAIATEHMIESRPDSMVIGIDWEFQPQYVEVYNRHPNNVVFICADTTSTSTVNRVSNILEGKTIDLLFLDSTHDGITPQMEFQLYLFMLSNETLICCDDIRDPRMKDFWKWLPGTKMELDDMHMAGDQSVGFGVSICHK